MEKLKACREALRSCQQKDMDRLKELLSGSVAEEDVRDQVEVSLQAVENRQERVEAMDKKIVDKMSDEDLAQYGEEIEKQEELRRQVSISCLKATRFLKSFLLATTASGRRISPDQRAVEGRSRNDLLENPGRDIPPPLEEEVIPEHPRFGSSTDSRASASASNPSTGQFSVKLPKLEIKQFDGDLFQWQPFWDSFESAIHQNASLSPTAKFNYLLSYLKGSALKTLAGLAATDASYELAITLLRERFGRTQVIIDAHINRLVSLAPVRKEADVVGLRQLYDECEINVRSLESLGVREEGYSLMLVSVLPGKLPGSVGREWERTFGESTPTLRQVREFLKTEVRIRERSAMVPREGMIQEKAVVESGGKTHKGMRTTTAAALAATGEIAPCVFCDSRDHRIFECSESVGEKRATLKRKGRCYVCLGHGHLARQCSSKNWKCRKCGSRHHTTICDGGVEKVKGPKGPDSAEKVNGPEVTVAQAVASEGADVFLETATVWLIGPKGKEKVRCLLDGGSQRTFISKDLSQRLKLKNCGQERLTINGVGGLVASHGKPSKRVLFKLQAVEEPYSTVELQALEIEVICAPISQRCDRSVLSEVQKRNLKLADESLTSGSSPANIDLLIGADYYRTIVKSSTKQIGKGPVAVQSVFGWLLHGPSQSSELEAANVMVATNRQPPEMDVDKDISATLTKFWELEAIGIKDSGNKPEVEDEKILKQFMETVNFENKRYEVSLPWNRNKGHLGTNRGLAERRLWNLVKKLRRGGSLWQRYGEQMREHLALDFIERVPEDEIAENGNLVHYLPHHPVVREDKDTTKVRIVFDASAKETGFPSLNECLDVGPNLNPELAEVLLRFRSFRVALTADIEKAFLQVQLRKEDRDVVRFLWVAESEGGDLMIEHYRWKKVVFGVAPSPFLLAATIRRHLGKHADKRLIEQIRNNLYVDDLMFGADEEEEAAVMAKEATDIFEHANMKLRKWASNSVTLQAALPGTEKVSTDCIEIEEDSGKVLGLTWDRYRDCFSFSTGNVIKFFEEVKLKYTKRIVLQLAGRIFDPLGFITPITTPVKVLMQRLWERGLAWDDPLPDEMRTEFESWVKELPNLGQIVVPRWYRTKHQGSVRRYELHVFCDASETGYGAVGYLRAETEAGDIETTLVASKARVALLKRLTLPRLELMGGVIAARLANYITTALQPLPLTTYLWTDSQIVLAWIRGSAYRWKPFVANRVQEIQGLTQPSSWAHCLGRDNPADLLSRGVSVAKLLGSQLWWKGPEWLRAKTGQTVVQETRVRENDCDELAIVADEMRKTTCNVNVAAVFEPLRLLFDPTRYSTKSRLIRVTAWIRRFVSNCRTEADARKKGELTAEELEGAEGFWVRLTQEEAFPAELKMLKTGQLPRDNKYASYRPYLDSDGYLRVRGRAQFSDLDSSSRNPVLLPTRHHFVKLLVEDQHCRLLHAGVRETLTELRVQYWIIRGRQLTKKILQHCVICKRIHGRVGSQQPAPLPTERSVYSSPFEVCGIDLAGPVYTKLTNRDGTVMKKGYICLFTCAVTRAVHLEFVGDLNTSTFLMAFRRFTARRGVPHIVYSDNAKTFKAASRALQNLWRNIDAETLQIYLAGQNIRWKFIVERAAWWGGFWERLVRSVKDSLKKVLGRACLSAEEFTTVLTEVEAVINSRPLTFVYNDLNEQEPLTPSHFLTGKRLTSLPVSGKENPGEQQSQLDLTRRAAYRELLVTRFTRRWKTEYLQEINCPKRGQRAKVPEPGDTVLIVDENTPRLNWRMAKVKRLLPGKDGLPRAVELQTSTGITRRAVQRVIALEVHRETDELGVGTPTPQPNEEPQTANPKEDAAETDQDVEDPRGSPRGEDEETPKIIRSRSGRTVRLPLRFSM